MIENVPMQLPPQYRNSMLIQSCWFFYHPDISTFEQAKQKIGDEAKFLIYFDHETSEFRLIYNDYSFEDNAQYFCIYKLNPNDTAAKLAVFFKNLKKEFTPVIYRQLEERYINEAEQVINALNSRRIEVGQYETFGDPNASLIPLRYLFHPSENFVKNCVGLLTINNILEISEGRVILLLPRGGYAKVYENKFFNEKNTIIINVSYEAYRDLKNYNSLPPESFFVYLVDRYLTVKNMMRGDWLERAREPIFNNPISHLKNIVENAPGYDGAITSRAQAEAKLFNLSRQLKLLSDSKPSKRPPLLYILRRSTDPSYRDCYVSSIMDKNQKITHVILETCGEYFKFFCKMVPNIYSAQEVECLSVPLQLLSQVNAIHAPNVRETVPYYPSPLQPVLPRAAQTENKEHNKEAVYNTAFTHK